MPDKETKKFSSVEFFGGPHDGLFIARGIDEYEMDPDRIYKVYGDGHYYRPHSIKDTTLLLKYIGVQR